MTKKVTVMPGDIDLASWRMIFTDQPEISLAAGFNKPSRPASKPC